MKTGGKNSVLLTFLLITLFYLVTRWWLFSGFNGTDDLHYALLASRMVKHRFNLFISNDIFSGRVLLIGIQALIYWLGGVHVVTTQLGTLFASTVACYLTVFRLLKYDRVLTVTLASSLFYFTPVLTGSTVGILPDPYIMLVSIFLVLFTKKIIFEEKFRNNATLPLLLGILIGLSLLIKEIALVFLFLVFILVTIYRPPHFIRVILLVFAGFSVFILLTGLYYYVHTGNAFFKISQIDKSNTPNSCSDIIGTRELILRLTYKPWIIMIAQGYYPVLFATTIFLTQWIKQGKAYLRTHFYSVVFFILLLLGLYFPFSLYQYKPVCFQCRHFLFLLPWAVVICAEYFYPFLKNMMYRNFMLWTSLIILVICVQIHYHKWEKLIYLLLTLFFLILPLMKKNPYPILTIFCGILWMSLLKDIFFNQSPWFREMQQMNRILPSGCFYFPESDNMMHWELLHRFNDKDNVFFDLEKNRYLNLNNNRSELDVKSFHPGWFILNSSYTVRSAKFISTMDSLKNKNAFDKTVHLPLIEAFYIESQQKLNLVSTMVERDQ